MKIGKRLGRGCDESESMWSAGVFKDTSCHHIDIELFVGLDYDRKGGRHYRPCFYGLLSEIGNQPHMKVFGLDKMPEHGVDIEMHQPRG